MKCFALKRPFCWAWSCQVLQRMYVAELRRTLFALGVLFESSALSKGFAAEGDCETNVRLIITEDADLFLSAVSHTRRCVPSFGIPACASLLADSLLLLHPCRPFPCSSMAAWTLSLARLKDDALRRQATQASQGAAGPDGRPAAGGREGVPEQDHRGQRAPGGRQRLVLSQEPCGFSSALSCPPCFSML